MADNWAPLLLGGGCIVVDPECGWLGEFNVRFLINGVKRETGVCAVEGLGDENPAEGEEGVNCERLNADVGVLMLRPPHLLHLYLSDAAADADVAPSLRLLLFPRFGWYRYSGYCA